MSINYDEPDNYDEPTYEDSVTGRLRFEACEHYVVECGCPLNTP